MGIDIYVRWENQTEEEQSAQYTGFCVTAGNVGYLREAYHGGPYATQILVKEAFESDKCEAEIPASVLRSRLPETISAVITRSMKIYKKELNENDPVVRSFVEFVELCERKEAETGKPCTIIASY